MADLTELQASLSIKLSGASPSGGIESYWAQVDSNGNQFVITTAAGSASGGTAATNSHLSGGIYNTALPTLTNGQQASLQLDSSGRLIVSPTTQGLLAEDHNYGTVGANTLRAAAQIGNATGAADFNAGATGAQTLRVVANQGAPNTKANAWFVTGTDGTNSQAYLATGEAKVSVTQPLPAGSNNIGSVNQGTSPWVVSGTVAVTQSTSPWVVSQSSTPWLTSDAADGSVAAGTAATKSMLGGLVYNSTPPTLTNGQQVALQGDSSGNLLVDLKTALPAGSNLIGAVNLDLGGSPVSSSNPVPVSITSALVGTSVNNYNTASAVAPAGTSNHTYTITSSKTFNGKKIWASASGKIKIEVRVSPDGSTYSTLFVGFNSTADQNISIDLNELVFLESGAGSTIQIIRTNMDVHTFDVYSTISGTEV